MAFLYYRTRAAAAAAAESLMAELKALCPVMPDENYIWETVVVDDLDDAWRASVRAVGRPPLVQPLRLLRVGIHTDGYTGFVEVNRDEYGSGGWEALRDLLLELSDQLKESAERHQRRRNRLVDARAALPRRPEHEDTGPIVYAEDRPAPAAPLPDRRRLTVRTE